MEINIILLICLLLASLWTVMTIRLVRAVVGLALTSAVLSAVMFRLSSSLAAVFELSVCAGLISVIFVTTVSFTHRVSQEMYFIRKKERFAKFWLLPFLLVLAGIALFYYTARPSGLPAPAPPAKDAAARDVMWNLRHLDLIGQVAALLAAAIGVAVLFKERKK
jgi:NADH-quinone oxidoreductase subunit J